MILIDKKVNPKVTVRKKITSRRSITPREKLVRCELNPIRESGATKALGTCCRMKSSPTTVRKKRLRMIERRLTTWFRERVERKIPMERKAAEKRLTPR